MVDSFGRDANKCVGVVMGACGSSLLFASDISVKWKPGHNLRVEVLKGWGKWKSCEIQGKFIK